VQDRIGELVIFNHQHSSSIADEAASLSKYDFSCAACSLVDSWVKDAISRAEEAALNAEYMKAMQLAAPHVRVSAARQAPAQTASLNWDSAMEAPFRAMRRPIVALRRLHVSSIDMYNNDVGKRFMK
jgi:hypothetical protein